MAIDIYRIPGKIHFSGISLDGVERMSQYLDLIEQKLAQNGAIVIPTPMMYEEDKTIENIVAEHLKRRTNAPIIKHAEFSRTDSAHEYADGLLIQARKIKDGYGVDSLQMNELLTHARVLEYSPKARIFNEKGSAILQELNAKHEYVLVMTHASTAQGLVAELAKLRNNSIPLHIRYGKRKLQRISDEISEQYGLPQQIVHELLTVQRNAPYLREGAAIRFDDDGLVKLIGPYRKKIPAGTRIEASEIPLHLIKTQSAN